MRTAHTLKNTITTPALASASSANGSTIVASPNSTASPGLINTPVSIGERGIVGNGPNEISYPSFREVLQYAGRYSKPSSALDESRFSASGKCVSKEQKKVQNSTVVLYKSRTLSSNHWIGATPEVITRLNLFHSQG